MELVDIGFNFTSSAFRKDADEVIERAKQAGVKHFVLTGSDVEESEHAIRLPTETSGFKTRGSQHSVNAQRTSSTSPTSKINLSMRPPLAHWRPSSSRGGRRRRSPTGRMCTAFRRPTPVVARSGNTTACARSRTGAPCSHRSISRWRSRSSSLRGTTASVTRRSSTTQCAACAMPWRGRTCRADAPHLAVDRGALAMYLDVPMI